MYHKEQIKYQKKVITFLASWIIQSKKLGRKAQSVMGEREGTAPLRVRA